MTRFTGNWGVNDVFHNINNLAVNSGVNILTDVIGVQDLGTRSNDGAGLIQVIATSNGLQETNLKTGFFDIHPSYQFPDWTDSSSNVFCEIPIAYWWRGYLLDPTGLNYRWTMLLSDKPGIININGINCEFKANPGAFKRNGSWMDKYYFGKYRGSNGGNNKLASKAGQTHWSSVSFDNFRTYASNNGEGYHMQSLQEWHEILGRAVIEKKSFELHGSDANRANASLCKYRGIEDFAYSGSVYAEWMDGIKTNGSGIYEVWEQANGNYVSTGVTSPLYGDSESTHYNQGLATGSYLDYMFVGATCGPRISSFIPDLSGRETSAYVNKICLANFHSGFARNGAFNADWNYGPSYVNADIGARLAKW